MTVILTRGHKFDFTRYGGNSSQEHSEVSEEWAISVTQAAHFNAGVQVRSEPSASANDLKWSTTLPHEWGRYDDFIAS